MITFKQFLEVREVRNIPQNDIREILRHIDDPIICVKFALYCAEDCFQFNNKRTREPAQRCIDLIRKWLRDPKSVTDRELRSAANNTNAAAATAATAATAAAVWSASSAFSAANAAASSASSAADVAAAVAIVNTVNVVDAVNWDTYIATNVVDTATYAAYAAAYKYHQYNTSQWRQIRNQKIQEYTRKLKGMTTTRTNYTKHSEMLKGYDNTEEAIRLALDELEDLGEIGKEHFVYQDDEGQCVFDLGHDNILRAASKEALARLIHNDRYYLNALMRLYNANI